MLDLKNSRIGYSIKDGKQDNEVLLIYSNNASMNAPITWRINIDNKVIVQRSRKPFVKYLVWNDNTWININEEKYNNLKKQIKDTLKKESEIVKNSFNISINKKVLSSLLGLSVTKNFYDNLNKRSNNKIITHDFILAIIDIMFTDPDNNDEYKNINFRNINLIDNPDLKKVLFNVENTDTTTLIINMFKDLIMGAYCLKVGQTKSWNDAREIIKDDVISENHPYLKTMANLLEINFNRSDDIESKIEKSHSILELIKDSINTLKKMNIINYSNEDNYGFRINTPNKDVNMKRQDIMKGLTLINFADNLMTNMNNDNKSNNDDDDDDDDLDGVEVLSCNKINKILTNKNGKYFMLPNKENKSILLTMDKAVAFNLDLFTKNSQLDLLSNNGSECNIDKKYFLDLKNNYILFDASNLFDETTKPLCFNIKNNRNDVLSFNLCDLKINNLTNIELDQNDIDNNILKNVKTYNMFTNRNIYIFTIYSLTKQNINLNLFINSDIDTVKVNNISTNKIKKLNVSNKNYYHNDMTYYKFTDDNLLLNEGNNTIIINNDDINVLNSVKDIKLIIIANKV